VHRAFGELRRLGLRRETEAAVRRALKRETGMLVIDQVVPGMPAHGKLEPGDVLLSLSAISEEQAAVSSGHAAAVHGKTAAVHSSTDAAAVHSTTTVHSSTDGAAVHSGTDRAAVHSSTDRAAVHSWRDRRPWCTTFLQMEELLDDRPGKWVCVAIQRGGVDISVPLRVADLHSFSASAVLEVRACPTNPFQKVRAPPFFDCLRWKMRFSRFTLACWYIA
jgi:hypothetical protein